MSPVGTVLSYILWAFLLLLIARLVISYVVALSTYRPRGYMAVLFEVVYTITDVPLRPLDRVLPAVRIGPMALSLSFPILFLAVSILLSQVGQW